MAEITLSLVNEQELLKRIMKVTRTSYQYTYHIYDIDGQTFYLYSNAISSDKVWKLEVSGVKFESHEQVFDTFVRELQALHVLRRKLDFVGE